MLLVCEQHVLWRLIVKHHVKGVVIVRHLAAEATEVEIVLDVILVHLQPAPCSGRKHEHVRGLVCKLVES